MLNDSSDKIENYKKNLMQYLVNNGKKQLQYSDDLECYISLFSFFICKSDPDYLYNLPFLREQHHNFHLFLATAPKKHSTLLRLADKVIAIPVINRIINDPAYKKQEILLSINDFLCVNLRNLDPVIFHDKLSISGGLCDPENDRFTFKFDSFIYSWDAKENAEDVAITKIDKLVQTLYYEGEE